MQANRKPVLLTCPLGSVVRFVNFDTFWLITKVILKNLGLSFQEWHPWGLKCLYTKFELDRTNDLGGVRNTDRQTHRQTHRHTHKAKACLLLTTSEPSEVVNYLVGINFFLAVAQTI